MCVPLFSRRSRPFREKAIRTVSRARRSCAFNPNLANIFPSTIQIEWSLVECYKSIYCCSRTTTTYYNLHHLQICTILKFLLRRRSIWFLSRLSSLNDDFFNPKWLRWEYYLMLGLSHVVSQSLCCKWRPRSWCWIKFVLMTQRTMFFLANLCKFVKFVLKWPILAVSA